MPAGLSITAGDAMASPHLFEPFFSGPSWATWRAVVKATFAESLTPAERLLFAGVAGDRQPPVKAVRELVCAVGRGGGKDSVASFLASYVAIHFNPKGRLRPGERAVVMCLATDRHQAGIVLGYIKGYFEEVPALRSLVAHSGAEFLDLKNGVTIEVHTNSYRGVRGRTLLCAIYDECAFWRDEHSTSPDIETDRAIAPGLNRMPGSLKIMISSVHKRSGLLFGKTTQCYGKDDPNVLAIMGSTLDFNPTFDRALIDNDMAEDSERFGAEYFCRWRDDLATFISRDLIEACVDRKVIVRPPEPGIAYVAGADASGGRNDSFTGAVSHRAKDGSVILDAVFERKAPFSPSAVVEELVALLKTYGCHSVTGDNYGAAWVSEAFQKAGMRYTKSERDRSAVYMDTLPLFTSGRARLLDNSRLISQFSALERRTFSTGRERIDPGPGHDDLANSAAIAMSLAASRTSGIVISPECLARASVPAQGGRPMVRGGYPTTVFPDWYRG